MKTDLLSALIVEIGPKIILMWINKDNNIKKLFLAFGELYNSPSEKQYPLVSEGYTATDDICFHKTRDDFKIETFRRRNSINETLINIKSEFPDRKRSPVTQQGTRPVRRFGALFIFKYANYY